MGLVLGGDVNRPMVESSLGVTTIALSEQSAFSRSYVPWMSLEAKACRYLSIVQLTIGLMVGSRVRERQLEIPSTRIQPAQAYGFPGPVPRVTAESRYNAGRDSASHDYPLLPVTPETAGRHGRVTL